MRKRLALLLAALASLAVGIDLVRPLPASWFEPVEARRVYARDGELLAERALPDRGRPEWVALDEVAPALIDGLIASEDRRFGHHPGVDPIAVGRAAWHDLRARAFVEGGSTLHQQTARLLAGRPGGLPGKAVEAWRALKLGWHLSDDEVLGWYLNRAYFGRGCWGVACAARRTFDESPASLSVSEAATLVGVLPSPERLHPEVDADAARRARDRVLSRMVAEGRLSPEVAEEARAEPIELRRRTPEGIAPHFVALALDDDPERAEVRTTLDAGLQRTVERVVREQLAMLQGREVDHASVLVVHLPSDEVRAWVGSAGHDAPSGQVDGVRAPRSPGSALKPFLYELAFERGDRPSDVLLDIPSRFGTTHGTWTPANYSGTFHGPVSMRVALGSSLNVPAVRLLDDLGVPVLQQRLVELGMDRVRRPASQVGLGLALGDVEVTLEQLATAYGALARGGRLRPFVRHVGGPLPPDREVLDPVGTGLVVDVLADPGARVLGFGRYGPLERAYPAAVKTGTSTDWRDNWTVGFTDTWLVAVWVGNFDHRAMVDVSGVTGAAPIWAAVMDVLVDGRAEPLGPPPGQEQRRVCALSGHAPGPGCPVATDWAPIGGADREPCAWHDEGGAVRWPPELAGWAASRALESSAVPGEGTASIAWPRDGAVLWVDPRQPPESSRLPLRAAAPSGSPEVDWRVDGASVGRGPADRPVLWSPARAGRHSVELWSEGQRIGAVEVDVKGVR